MSVLMNYISSNKREIDIREKEQPIARKSNKRCDYLHFDWIVWRPYNSIIWKIFIVKMNLQTIVTASLCKCVPLRRHIIFIRNFRIFIFKSKLIWSNEKLYTIIINIYHLHHKLTERRHLAFSHTPWSYYSLSQRSNRMKDAHILASADK